MAIKTIDAGMLQKMFLSGARRIEGKKEWINELNVFPVPDGDTGTNMSLTIMAAAKEVSQIAEPTMDNLAKAISMGALRGARGNSGVILSQLFRGFTKEIKEYSEINMSVMADAFARATETAYKAVMKPKEGTILTVARGMAEKIEEVAIDCDDLEEGLKEVLEYGDYVLSQTPELLPVLKQAGVVDSGGQGLMEVLKGCYDCLIGKESDTDVTITAGAGPASVSGSGASSENIDTADIKFGYCTEFIVMLEKAFNEDTEHEFKEYLASIGDSIVCVWLDDIVKVHVHTNDPGLAIQKGLSYGSLTSMKIDNMREEHHEKVIKDAQKVAAMQLEEEQEKARKAQPRKENGFISVSVGEGMNEIFKGLGVDYIIEGGQTMNPSTEDMLNAIEHVNADTIYIFPNNKNIILAAQQAQSLTEDKEIIVIPSKTVPQGITALINFVPGQPSQENAKRMTEEMSNVKSGQVTYAVRDTMIDDKTIKEGNIMGIGDSGILSVGEDIAETTKSLIDALMDDDAELISIYYGADVSEEDAQTLADAVEEKYPDCDIELQSGGQPIYYYIVSVE
ncbi:MAG TPA: DAK2 domain-containing protein [Candidatus Scybalocola faecigallinarum]|uniref:DAK2 domain-containing protein n=1 Tax=Candidatus Scybalocola faecigallinarum TaxID=2840941 RepID=A0A9D1F658_9FIRM|nr:DAK2 domain-containing protein [Candidatus Scybalocola faecigallinarum]